MNDAPLTNRELLAMVTNLLEERPSADEPATTTLVDSACLHSPVVYIGNRWYETADSTFGANYVIGLEIEDGVLTTVDPNCPKDFPSSFEVVPIPTSGDASCNERREHRIVALRGAAAVATFRKLKWNAVATVVQPTTKPQPLTEIKPPAQAPVTKAGLRISRDDESVKVRYPC